MALAQATVMAQIGTLLRLETSAFRRVYTQGTTDGNRIPGGPPETPCAVVMDNGTPDYLLTQPRHRHTYEVEVLCLVSGGDFGERMNALLAMKEAVMNRLYANVTLGGIVTKCLFRRSGPPDSELWSNTEFTAQSHFLEVEEHATANAQPGS